MKKILISLMALALNAVAAESQQSHTFEAMVSVNDLECSLSVGANTEKTAEERLFATIGSRFGYISIVGDNRGDEAAKTELEHKMAVGGSCPLPQLDELKKRSHQRFGFVSAQVTLDKKQGPSAVNGFGECVALFEEKLTIRLADTVTVVSDEGELRKVNDCR